MNGCTSAWSGITQKLPRNQDGQHVYDDLIHPTPGFHWVKQHSFGLLELKMLFHYARREIQIFFIAPRYKRGRAQPIAIEGCKCQSDIFIANQFTSSEQRSCLTQQAILFCCFIPPVQVSGFSLVPDFISAHTLEERCELGVGRIICKTARYHCSLSFCYTSRQCLQPY